MGMPANLEGRAAPAPPEVPPEVPPVPAVIPTDPPQVAAEDHCGDVGPRGYACRLRKGHEPPDLHAASGETWIGNDKTADGWQPPSAREIPSGNDPAAAEYLAQSVELQRRAFELQRRGVEASERTATALEAIKTSLEHYVEKAIHTVQGH